MRGGIAAELHLMGPVSAGEEGCEETEGDGAPQPKFRASGAFSRRVVR